ncbi:tRNA (adenosine(37)-N6)-threonylcarbamoyltransferase complex transferase subunit TsaD [Anoxynatronum buryatiense]|nr:tRNA (adenosine(37)-N6)-threonylcarbamoyltransferase complex transferase subunit TsaD [Anoxynatronum buryatiense]
MPPPGWLTLGIETSCDETAVSVVRDGRQVLSSIVASQIPEHQKFGGVVPEVASRQHVETITQVIDEALREAEVSLEQIHQVAVTYGPGLVGALLVGVAAAKALAYGRRLPLNGVNHIEGHLFANFIQSPSLEPPLLALIVSGGHTHLVHMKQYGVYEILGKTRDDAAGEAFDKVARVLGLGYPGGPLIDAAARQGDPRAIDFPRAVVTDHPWDFSFSGLKSAVLNHVNTVRMKGHDVQVADVAASFQQAVVDVLVNKTLDCAVTNGIKQVVLSGGVAANSLLRQTLADRCREQGIAFCAPDLALCTDNGAMIACVGYYDYSLGIRSRWNLNAVAGLSIGERNEQWFFRDASFPSKHVDIK